MKLKTTTFLPLFLPLLIGCVSSPEKNISTPNRIEIAAKKACDCKSVSVIESSVNGKKSIEITVVKTKFPDFQKRTTKIMKQIAKDVKGFCDTDDIKIHYVSNTHKVQDRTVDCKCPEERQPQAADSIILRLNKGIISKSSSSRIAQRESGENILILSIRDLDENVMSNNEAILKLKEKLNKEYPNLCDSITEVSFEFYTSEDGYRATLINCQDIYK